VTVRPSEASSDEFVEGGAAAPSQAVDDMDEGR
jgi:hypothetical protein